MPFVANRKPPQLSAGTECTRGAAIGAASGFVFAGFGGATTGAMLLTAAATCAVGALIALLFWSASEGAPEDPVLPPRDER